MKRKFFITGIVYSAKSYVHFGFMDQYSYNWVWAGKIPYLKANGEIVGDYSSVAFVILLCKCLRLHNKMTTFAKRTSSMTSKSIKKRILDFEMGKVFRTEDLGLSRSEHNAAVVALGRLVQEGEIERLSPGIYYKPKQTRFGIVGPSMEERFRDLLYEGDTPIGYLTGFYAFNLFGLTTQQSSTLEIGTNFPKRNTKRGIYAIRFVLQKNPISIDNIEMLRLLDCLKWIKKIPDATVDKSYILIKKKVNEYAKKEQKQLVELSLKYAPLTRALLGSMLTDELLVMTLHQTLSPLTRFRIGLSPKLVSDQWNIQ